MLDLLTRLDPVIHEIERARDPLLIVTHRVIDAASGPGVWCGLEMCVSAERSW